MKKRTFKTIFFVGVATVLFSFSSFAGTWQQDASGWKYQNDDNTYFSSGWNWIDGNGDGIAEYYYFGADGICLANTVTPDGLTVDANGAWTVNGIVQTQASNSVASAQQTGQTPQQDSSANAVQKELGSMVWISGGGTKYHSKSTCSNMKNPTQISKDDAELQGRTPCSKCY